MNKNNQTKAFLAKWILDPGYDIIENGVIVTCKDRIKEVGERREVHIPPGTKRYNLEETLLLPGLINMHTHLEQGACRDIKKGFSESFTAWEIKRRNKIRKREKRELLSSSMLALREAISCGCTTVVDFSSRPELTHRDAPVRIIPIWELSAQEDRKRWVEDISDSYFAGVSPYSLYSFSISDQRSIIESAKSKKRLWLSHAAESSEEFQAFTENSGDLFFQSSRNTPWPFKDKKGTIIEQAVSARIIPDRGILIHCNYISSMDMLLLKPKNVSIVVCPVYSSYAEHKPFPYEVASRSGLNICIGTEAPLPENKFDIFNELYEIKKKHPYIPVKRMLKWITQNPAKALGIGDITGSLRPGLKADITGIRFTYPNISDPAEQLVLESPEVICVVSNGEEVIMP